MAEENPHWEAKMLVSGLPHGPGLAGLRRLRRCAPDLLQIHGFAPSTRSTIDLQLGEYQISRDGVVAGQIDRWAVLLVEETPPDLPSGRQRRDDSV
jgi:hypothetical protein